RYRLIRPEWEGAKHLQRSPANYRQTRDPFPNAERLETDHDTAYAHSQYQALSDSPRQFAPRLYVRPTPDSAKGICSEGSPSSKPSTYGVGAGLPSRPLT